MSSDTDHPRQRTVAELLAENAGSTTGRRRRRREGDDDAGGGVAEERGTPQRPPAGGPAQSGAHRGAPPQQSRPENRPEQRSDPAADRWSAPLSAPQAPQRRSGYEGATVPEVRPASLQQPPHVPAPPQSPEPGRQPPRRHGPPPVQQGTGAHNSAPPVQRRPDEQQRNPWAPERPTQQMPRVDRRDDDTGPIAGSPRRGADDGGPPTVLGAPPVTDEPRSDLRGDGGPPTQASPFDPDDVDDFEGPVHDAGDDDGPGARTTAIPAGGRRSVADLDPTDLETSDENDAAGGEQATTAMRTPPRRPRDRPAGLRSRDEVDDFDEDDLDEVEAAPHSWAAVIGQWIGGAVVGAGLWVGFAFLWLHLPVVALAGAVVVTVALVLGVRAMLRDDNLRTTLFAVLVGLLLTVSPAILVLARQQV
ncbi:MAG: hypothetical protein J0I34_09435 [Pseudonocardia sp.]|uniref:hypothetical protein n=1 Tax=unclassified Pseudonocardia TaxID=2619320 RepID=UPI000AC18390|nr:MULTISPECIES: hypothetical protein [unclassified Pseudonocardia]MBN9108993.1 hypothetical protein [Pseudonocardia sp.]